jgi:hypothetical protein
MLKNRTPRLASSLILLTVLTGVAQAAPPPNGAADTKVKELLLLMDKDQNGKVSRAEFMSFMSAEFDRLDVNKNGELDVKELDNMRYAPGKHVGGTSK